MKAFDRRSEIVKYLQENERASTRQLSSLFDVSEVTIRHDLKELGKRGWVERVHGGAEVVRRLHYEQSFSERQAQNLSAKKKIARVAAKLIQPEFTIILDSSTTAFQLALLLRDRTGLRIVTNNLQIVSILSPNKEIETIMVGGVVREETASVVGPPAEEMLSRWHADQGFFGAAGLTEKRGLTDVDIREARVKEAMVAIVDQVNILLDISKIGNQAFSTFADLNSVDRLITDEPIPQQYVEICGQLDIEHCIA